MSNADLRRSFEERWRHLGHLPNWVLRDPYWPSEAWKVLKDYRKAKGVLFSTLLKDSLREGERARALLPTLWDLDPSEYSDKWLSEVCGGLDTSEMREIFESSAVSTVYRCLDCMDPLTAARTREQAFLRNKALRSARLGSSMEQVIAAEAACELLCPNCAEHRLRERQDRIRELRSLYYRAFLRSDEWSAISNLKLHEANFLCAICRRTKKPMDVHHLLYDHRGDESLDDLLVLCNPHHKFLHRLQQEASREEG